MRRLLPRPAACLAALALPALLAAQRPGAGAAPGGRPQPPFGPAVGPLDPAPGSATSGYLEVPARGDSATRVPVTVIRGTTPGPTLALVAGTHGAEVAPIVALQRLRPMVAPAQLRGTLVLVHVANLPSYLHRTVYRGPWDQKNLNRVYPGRDDGTVSERIAAVITREVIDKCDYLVDMHAGDGNESLRPYTYWSKLGLDARVDSLALEMALAWGHDHIVIDPDRPKDRAASLYVQNTAQVRGKPAITTETGWLGVPDPEMVARNVDGALRLLRALGMLPGPVEKVRRPVWIDRTQVVASPATGAWEPAVSRSEYVAEGTVLGRVRDLFGNVVAEVTAPFAGVVLYVIGSPAMSVGEPVAFIGRVGTGPR
jgi:predicted deacylase